MLFFSNFHRALWIFLLILAALLLPSVNGEEARDNGTEARFEEISLESIQNKLRAAKQAFRSSDIENALKLVDAAAEEARALKSVDLEAQALALQGQLLEAAGKLVESLVAFDDARRLYAQAGDDAGVARTLGSLGIVRQQRGDLDGAIALYQQSLDIYRDKTLRDEGNRGRTLRNLGAALVTIGELREAEGHLLEARSILEQAGRPGEVGSVVMELGNLRFAAGEMAQAEASYKSAIERFKKAGLLRGVAMARTNLGEIFALAGDVQSARKAHDDARALYLQANDTRGLCYSDFRLAEIQMLEGSFEDANQLYERADEQADELADEALSAQIRVGRARALRLGGDLDAALEIASGVEKELQRFGIRDLAILARVETGYVLLEQQKAAAAEDVYEELAGHLEGIESLRVQLSIRLLGLGIEAVAVEAEGSSRLTTQLREVATVAAEAGLKTLEYEARLLLGTVDLATGRGSGREALLELGGEASEKGLGQYVDRVNATLEAGSSA